MTKRAHPGLDLPTLSMLTETGSEAKAGDVAKRKAAIDFFMGQKMCR